MLNNRVILITGGTGSFGKQFVKTVLERFQPKRLIIFSRDELKQYEMREAYSETQYTCLRYFIGDVRDRNRLYRALNGVEIVVHAAAMKQVPTAEYNPIEAIKTNVNGAENVIDASIDCRVQRVIAISTDKAVNPINLYGATKLCSDKLFVAANSYAGAGPTRFSVVRYGNVMGSRGSVIPLFLKKRREGVLPVTDPRMTRFWITLEQGVDFVLKSLNRMRGGEIFVPKIPSMNMRELARAIAPDCRLKIIGIRAGEKLHEVLITADDARHTLDYPNYYIILPSFHQQEQLEYMRENGGRPCPPDFQFSSDNNTLRLDADDLLMLTNNTEESVVYA